MTDKTESLVDVLASTIGLVSISATRLGVRKTDKAARADLAHSRGVDEHQYSVSKNLLPGEYGDHIKPINSAVTEGVTALTALTMPAPRRGDGFIKTDPRSVAEFFTCYKNHTQILDQLRLTLKLDWDNILDAIERDPRYSAEFDRGAMPTADDIDVAFRITVDGPRPLGSFTYIPMPENVANALEARYAAQLEAQVKEAQQGLAMKSIELVRNLSEQLTRRVEFVESGQVGTKAKRSPKIYDSLVENVREAVDRMERYALPGETGDRLRALAQRVRDEVVPPQVTVDVLRESVPSARKVAEAAAAVLADLDEADLFD